MALPKSVETPRGLELQAKLKAAIAADRSLKEWPMPTRDDYVVIGGIIVLFSYVEFNLRRLAEVFDHADLLPLPWKGRAVDLNIGEVERAVQAARVWAGPADVEALKTLVEDRRLRNLVAHFVVRRFPSDEAFLFIAKNAKDYEREFGAKPAPGVALTAVVEREQVVNALGRIERLQNWLAQVAVGFEKRLLPTPPSP
jgi:hypothetical protein